MTTQTTKPERARTVKIEPGVRVELDGLKGRIIERSQGDCWKVLWTSQGGGQWKTEWRETSFFTRSDVTYLGPTEPGGGDAAPPAPAVGQRWRDRGDVLGDKYYNGDVFELTAPDRILSGNWFCDRGGTSWHGSHFKNGRLAFVDHGDQAPAAPPKTAPSVPTREIACSDSQCGTCTHCQRRAQRLRTEAALQPLATFFLPGDVAEQTTAYFTRTRAR